MSEMIEKRRVGVSVLVLLLLSLVSLLSSSGNGKQTRDQQDTKFEENVFSFEIPERWKRVTGSKLEQYRQEQITGLRELLRKQPFASNEDFKGLVYLARFNAPIQDCSVQAVSARITPQGEDFLDRQYESYKLRTEWFITQGNVRKVLRIQKVEIGGVPAIELDLEMTSGRRIINYHFYSPRYPDLSIGLIMISEAGRYSACQPAFDHLLSTLSINFEAEKAK